MKLSERMEQICLHSFVKFGYKQKCISVTVNDKAWKVLSNQFYSFLVDSTDLEKSTLYPHYRSTLF